MALSQQMILWVSERVKEAKEILASPDTTPNQKTVVAWS